MSAGPARAGPGHEEQPQLFLQQLPGGGSSVSGSAPELRSLLSGEQIRGRALCTLRCAGGAQARGGGSGTSGAFREVGTSGKTLPCAHVSEGDVVEALGGAALRRRRARQPAPLHPAPAAGSRQRQDDDGQEDTDHRLCRKAAGGALCKGRRCCRESWLRPQPGRSTVSTAPRAQAPPAAPGAPSQPQSFPHLALAAPGWNGSSPRRCKRCHPMPRSPPSATSVWSPQR